LTAAALGSVSRSHRRSGAAISGVPVEGETGTEVPGGDVVAAPVLKPTIPDPDEFIVPGEPVVPEREPVLSWPG
jgi:hypothetical protein